METRTTNKHGILSGWVILCGLLYIFAYQFKLPFKADSFLYGMVAGLVAMTLLDGRVIISKQLVLFVFVAISSFVGVLYSTMTSEGLREAILFIFFAGLFALSAMYPSLIKSFVRWIYSVSIVLVLSSILQFLVPTWFNLLMQRVLQEHPYEYMMWSYNVDNTFAGIAAYTPNTTFSAAIVFGHSFLHLVNKQEHPVGKHKLWHAILLVLSLFVIILCSKRGIFVATVAALLVLMFYLYRGKPFILKFFGVAVALAGAMVLFYQTSEYVSAFFDRFTGNDFMTGRDVIYKNLLNDLQEGNLLIGCGTGATYKIAESGAHNIYIQIIYDHGIIFSIPYYVFMLYNYYLSFKYKCPPSIFVQTLFLVYGLSGNPLYSNMFMIIYVYYVLYATIMPISTNQNQGNNDAAMCC